ncbi:plastocyanin/azurin family copper-binding protein [bacterium]|nr:plastocyanin/azurin family copper-binding protein [bacterium]
MKLRLIGIVLLLMIAVYAHAPQNAVAEGDKSKVVVVEMQGYHFKPDKITIEPGTTVEWINTGKIAHTVTDDHDAWDSGSLKPGEKFSRRFDEKGTFKYYCIPHREAQMLGTINVK